jgi:hypothetical protein
MPKYGQNYAPERKKEQLTSENRAGTSINTF